MIEQSRVYWAFSSRPMSIVQIVSHVAVPLEVVVGVVSDGEGGVPVGRCTEGETVASARYMNRRFRQDWYGIRMAASQGDTETGLLAGPSVLSVSSVFGCVVRPSLK